MITGQNKHDLGIIIFYKIKILVNRIGGAPVPVGGAVSFGWRQDGNAPVSAYHVPCGAASYVVDQGKTPVLAQDCRAFQARMHEVA